MIVACPKPEPLKRTKRRKLRKESEVKMEVRAFCVVRDGDCRLRGRLPWFPCDGVSEWAHLGDKKRARTRGMKPEDRHTSAGSMMLCTVHHRAYDDGRMSYRPLTKQGANGLVVFRFAYVHDTGAVTV